MSKLKVGTRVLITTNIDDGIFKGKKGTIRRVNNSRYWPYEIAIDGEGSDLCLMNESEFMVMGNGNPRKPRQSKPNSQTAVLLNHFKTAKSISNVEAQVVYRIRSLSRRVNDLEAQGHVIARERKVDPTGQRYVRYHYVGEKKAA